jgi:hypothetical protein
MNPLNLQQVLMNLVLNARAAMLTDRPAGDHRLTVAAITRADGTIGIRVTDTGPGIAPEIAGRIFEPFVTTKRKGDLMAADAVDNASVITMIAADSWFLLRSVAIMRQSSRITTSSAFARTVISRPCMLSASPDGFISSTRIATSPASAITCCATSPR